MSDIIKRKPGRPKKDICEEIVNKQKNKPGRKAREYTKKEIISKIQHFKDYQKNYKKKLYKKKDKNNDILNHSQAKKYLLLKENLNDVISFV